MKKITFRQREQKNVPITNMVTCWTYIFDIMKVQHIFHLTSIVPRILWLNVVFCSKNSRLTCISYSCECLVDITSCILAEDESKLDADHTISPLKEPLKKKGNDITNPYPNFKVCTHHTTETDHVDQLLWFLHFAFDTIYQTQKKFNFGPSS